MSSMFPADPRARATWRWGGAIAALLVVQSLVLSGLFWLLASGSHRSAAEATFAADCRTLAALTDAERHAALRHMIAEDTTAIRDGVKVRIRWLYRLDHAFSASSTA